jgi:hypothetical protein
MVSPDRMKNRHPAKRLCAGGFGATVWKGMQMARPEGETGRACISVAD